MLPDYLITNFESNNCSRTQLKGSGKITLSVDTIQVIFI